MGLFEIISDEINAEVSEYWREKDVNGILESIVTGLAYDRPSDPLLYIEQCAAKIRKTQKVQWDTFVSLPPIETQKIPSLVGKKFKTPMPVVPLNQPNLKSQGVVLPPISGSALIPSAADGAVQQNNQPRSKAWANIVYILGNDSTFLDSF